MLQGNIQDMIRSFLKLVFFMKKRNWPIAPLALGMVLGPLVELSIRQAVASGGPTVFFTRPVSLAFILLAIVASIIPFVMKKKLKRDEG